MLVDLIRMRSCGQKLAAEHLAGVPPLRGTLLIERRYEAHKNTTVLFAAVMSLNRHEPVVPVLDRAVVTRLAGDRLVIAGIEEVRDRRDRQYFRQAWLCTLVKG